MITLHDLVLTMFKILDRVEMSNNGKEFHPTTISSCREMDRVKLNDALMEMRTVVGLGKPEPLRKRSELEEGVCPTCNGTGDPYNHERDWCECYTCEGSGHVVKCTNCNGTGVVELGDFDTCDNCHATGFVANRD